MNVPSNDAHPPQGPGRRRRQSVRRQGQPRRRDVDDIERRPQVTSDRLWEFAVLAHELKQPLTAILSNAGAARRLLTLDTPDIPTIEEVRMCLADIIADARRTGEVLRRLQAFVTTGVL